MVKMAMSPGSGISVCRWPCVHSLPPRIVPLNMVVMRERRGRMLTVPSAEIGFMTSLIQSVRILAPPGGNRQLGPQTWMFRVQGD